MPCISTVVFFDIETTGLPFKERNRTKIIELSFVAVARSDLMRNDGITIPPVSKLTFILNPQKAIISAEITGLTNDIVKYSPTFKEKFNTIKSFLEDLSKPVCLVAHNGNAFDYKILLAECVDANLTLPEDLLCVDSLPYFRNLFKQKLVQQKISPSKPLPKSPEITDDEDDWPDLNVTPEEFQEIDDLCSSLSGMSCNSNLDKHSKQKTNVPNVRNNDKKAPASYKLTDIYRKLLKREPHNAHRAEDDCIILLQCVGVCQNTSEASDSFLIWLDGNCKNLKEISPLQRK